MGGFVKYFGVSFDEVLDMSWANIQMYNASIPSFDSEPKEKKKGLSFEEMLDKMKKI